LVEIIIWVFENCIGVELVIDNKMRWKKLNDILTFGCVMIVVVMK